MPRPPPRFTPLPVDRTTPTQSRAIYVPAEAVPGRDVPYVPSDPHVVRRMLTFAGITADDVVYDLGCGDGRIVIAAARDFGATGVGIDIDPARIQECHEAARRAGVQSRVSFRLASLFDTDLSPATLVATYLLPAVNSRLKSKYLSELRPGARIVSNQFDMGDWKEDEIVTVGERKIRKWIVPAYVTGHWDCIASLPNERIRFKLHLTRACQYVFGAADLAGKNIPLQQGKIHASNLSFQLIDWSRNAAQWRFHATVEIHNNTRTLRGHCTLNDAPDQHPWGATRA